jgi:hypothetical protein
LKQFRICGASLLEDIGLNRFIVVLIGKYSIITYFRLTAKKDFWMIGPDDRSPTTQEEITGVRCLEASEKASDS